MASNASELENPLALAGETPVVGITSYLERSQTGVWDVPASFLHRSYLEAIAAGGAIPVVLPPQVLHPGAAEGLLSRLDGLVLAGGADVDPRQYGADPHPQTGSPREDRDAFEIALVRSALRMRMPLFGICRGAQILNVALGGTLHQHLPDLVGSKKYQPAPAVFGSEAVHIDAGTLLYATLGEQATVPVYHHQAIDRVAEGVIVTARTDDGIIQAIELPDQPYAIAVQWHPEADPSDRRLFVPFAQAAQRYRTHRGDLTPPESEAEETIS